MAVRAEIIAIGNEILGGHTVDTNSSWIAARLKTCGITISKKQVIRDSEYEIRRALDHISEDTRYIFISGGLGPTRDDITKGVISSYFDSELVFDQSVFEDLSERYRIRGTAFLEKNRGQAMFPEKAEIIRNLNGTAPGMHFSREGRDYFVMPGVPSEMKGMMESGIIPLVCETGESRFREITLRTTGVPESELAALVEPAMAAYPDVELGFYPGYQGVDLRLNSDRQDSQLEESVGALQETLGDIIYCRGTDDLAEVLADIFTSRGLTLALAESCTGGMVAHRITGFAGSSAYFRESLVVYSNEAKIKRLGVDPLILEKYGAVSEETVAAMLEGLSRSSDAEVFAAVSGIAGPDGGTEEKPVGTVWLGVADRNSKVTVLKRFTQDRKRNINFSAQALLNLIRLFVMKSPQTEELGKYWK